ncbi:MAG: hypothetical protein ACK4N5_00360, partial [Myxococcales bacterium]
EIVQMHPGRSGSPSDSGDVGVIAREIICHFFWSRLRIAPIRHSKGAAKMADGQAFDAAVRAKVVEEVERVFGPYRDLLDGLSAFVSGQAAPPRRGPGRPRAAPNAPRRAGGRGRGRKAAAAQSGGGDASKFTEGQEVKYRQGRGEFEAVVMRIDRENNVLFLERKKDGKKVQRPASKIYA